MDFDFAKLYKPYTNIELLKIIRHPEKFQEAAVNAANEILDTRTVTDEEREAAGFVIKQPEMNIGFSGHSSEQDVLESFNPDANGKESLWFIIFFSLICIFYIRYFYYSFRSMLLIFEYGYYSATSLFYNLFYLFAIPLILLGFYRRKKITWFILIAENVLKFSFFTTNFLDPQANFTGLSFNDIVILTSVLLRPVIIYFLMQPQMTVRFNITVDQKKKTLLAVLGIFILIVAVNAFLKSGKTL